MDCVGVTEEARRGVMGEAVDRKEVEKRYIALPETLSHIKSFAEKSVVYININFKDSTYSVE